MEIELNDEQKLLRDTVRRFAEEVVKPRAKEIDESGEFPRGFFDQAGELGLTGVAIPEEYGGAGMDIVSYALVVEEVSRVCATSGVILSVNNSLVCDPILKFGSEEQKKEFLTPLGRGQEARLLRPDRARRRERRRVAPLDGEEGRRRLCP